MYRLSILLEASKYVGTGHMRETLTLLRELSRVGEFEFDMSFTGEKEFQNIIENSGINYLNLNVFDTLKEAVEKQNFNETDLIYFNSTRRSPAFYRELKRKNVPIIGIFDDNKNEDYNLEAYINTSILALDTKNVHENHYLGPDYMIFNPILSKRINQLCVRVPKLLPSVLLTLGGTDPYHLTAKVIESISPLKDLIMLQVILTDGFNKGQISEIANYANRNRNIVMAMNLSQEDMFSAMMSSDIAISAAGNTLYELCLLGIPAIVVPHHILHNKVAQKFEECGAAINVGIWNQKSGNKICSTLKNLLNDINMRKYISKNAKSITDGCGLERVVKIICSILVK